VKNNSHEQQRILAPDTGETVTSSVEKFLIAGIENRATSIYMFPGSCITYRVGNKLLKVPNTELTANQVLEIAIKLFPNNLIEEKDIKDIGKYLRTVKSVDFVHSIHGVARFRINAFRQRGSLAISIRVILQQIPSLKDYDLPEDFFQLLNKSRGGLFVIHGKARSGKSSFLAAIVDYLNKNLSQVVVILEPSLQYTHRNQFSLITQREIGIDMPSLRVGVEEALKQDQDIILLDELTDTGTFKKLMEAVFKGIRVFLVVGTPDTEKTLQHLLNFKHPELQIELINDFMTVIKALLCTSIKVQPNGQRIFNVEFKSSELLNSLLLSRRRELQGKSGQLGFDEKMEVSSSVDQSWFDAD